MHRYTQYMYSYPHKTAYRPLKNLSLKDFTSCLSSSHSSLYLHIPFCETKCGYCNLFSVTGQGQAEIDRYLDAVDRQIHEYSQILSQTDVTFTDFTIGGGTPLLLSEAGLLRIFAMVKSQLPLAEQSDIIIETAPNQTNPEKLKILKDAGVTRVSMGIQSFHDNELKTLKRHHKAEKARKSLSLLMSMGFSCVNVDFIYGIPGQTVDSLLQSLKEAVSYSPDELFLYPLYIKSGTILDQDLKNGLVQDENLAYLQYQEASAFLQTQGYRQDSMRRFVRCNGAKTSPDFKDCGFGNALSLGCGGRSYLGNLHFCTPYAINQSSCLKQLQLFENTRDFTTITHGILLNKEEQTRRYVIRHLLIQPGLKKEQYQDCFHTSVLADFPILQVWLEKGYLIDNGRYLSLTKEGLGLSDYLGPSLISPEVMQKMKEWEDYNGN